MVRAGGSRRSASMVPPWAWTMSRVMASPRPVPPRPCRVVTNGSKTSSPSSAGTPGPVSCTSSRMAPSTATATSTLPPGGVAWIALRSRLWTTSSSCTRLPWATASSGVTRQSVDAGPLGLGAHQHHLVAGDVHEVDGLALEAGGTRQLQQVGDDAGDAERLLLELLDERRPRVAGRGQLAQELRVGGDARHRRVDLVGEPGRQAAQGRQPLLVGQALLERQLVRDVVERHHPAVEAPGLDLQGRRGEQAAALALVDQERTWSPARSGGRKLRHSGRSSTSWTGAVPTSSAAVRCSRAAARALARSTRPWRRRSAARRPRTGRRARGSPRAAGAPRPGGAGSRAAASSPGRGPPGRRGPRPAGARRDRAAARRGAGRSRRRRPCGRRARGGSGARARPGTAAPRRRWGSSARSLRGEGRASGRDRWRPSAVRPGRCRSPPRPPRGRRAATGRGVPAATRDPGGRPPPRRRS